MASDTPSSRADLAGLTQAFLFADLRGYTAFADLHGDRAAADLLRRYRTVVRAAVAQTGGAEIRTEGDSFFVVFDSVSSALRCGLAIIDAARADADGPRIEVGIGVHAGEAEPTDEGPVGTPINIAARLCAEAAAGELVVSDTVRSLTRTTQAASFIALGSRRLKGVAEPMTLYRVVPRGAVAEPRRRHRDEAGRRRRMAMPLMAVAAIAAIASVLAILGAMGRTPPAPSTSPMALTASVAITASPTDPPSSRPSEPGASSDTGIPSAGDPFPTTAEAALLNSLRVLPASDKGDCTRGSYAVLRGYDGRAIPVASVVCTPGITTGASSVLYRRFGGYRESGGPADFGVSVIGNIAAGKEGHGDDILPGDCATSGRAEARWEIPTVATGSLLCYVEQETGDAVLWWSYDGVNFVVEAVNQRGDRLALYAYFNRVKGLIAP